MKARSVLLDHTFVDALLAEDDIAHDPAIALYADLVRDYEAGTHRLFAIADVLRRLPKEVRRHALAPVETLWVGRQHRTAARAVIGATTPELAMSLVMLQREAIRIVATTTHDFDQLNVTVLLAAPNAEGDEEQADSPDGYVSSRTEPLPALRPTAE